MKEFHQSDRRQMPGERSQNDVAQRDRDYSKRQKRARKHLERMRSEPQPQPPFQLVGPAAVVASLAIGVLVGSPLVATARSWIAGEPVRIEAISVRGTEHLSPAEIAETTG